MNPYKTIASPKIAKTMDFPKVFSFSDIAAIAAGIAEESAIPAAIAAKPNAKDDAINPIANGIAFPDDTTSDEDSAAITTLFAIETKAKTDTPTNEQNCAI